MSYCSFCTRRSQSRLLLFLVLGYFGILFMGRLFENLSGSTIPWPLGRELEKFFGQVMEHGYHESCHHTFLKMLLPRLATACNPVTPVSGSEIVGENAGGRLLAGFAVATSTLKACCHRLAARRRRCFGCGSPRHKQSDWTRGSRITYYTAFPGVQAANAAEKLLLLPGVSDVSHELPGRPLSARQLGIAPFSRWSTRRAVDCRRNGCMHM